MERFTEGILRALIAAMLAAFVLCGVWGHNAAICGTTRGDGAFNSSDRFLSPLFEANGASEKILASISDLPPGKPLALLVPITNTFGPLMQETISSIIWPRKLCLMPVENGNARATFDYLHGTACAGILFFGATLPVASVHTRRVGQLAIIPLSKSTQLPRACRYSHTFRGMGSGFSDSSRPKVHF